MKKYEILFFCSIVIFFGCSNNKSKDQAGNADYETVLTIGKVNISRYELIKNFKSFNSDFVRANGRPPQPPDIQQWETKFINRTYILADAYDKGYDKDGHIDSLVQGAARFMIAQPNGLLEQKLTGNDAAKVNVPMSPVNEQPSREQMLKQQEVTMKYNEKIDAKAQVAINDKMVNAFSAKLNNYNYGINHTFIKKDFNDILLSKILTYTTPEGKRVSVTVNDFIDFYNTLFIKQAITGPNVVINYLTSMPRSIYAYNDAVKLGLTKESKFLLDENNFKNQLIYNKYSTDFLEGKQPITDEEILNEYNLAKSSLVQPTDAIVSIYYFLNRNSAVAAMFRLKEDLSDSVQLVGVEKAKKHIKVNYKSSSLPDTLMKTIMQTKNKAVSRPINLGNNIVLIKKEHESGNRTLDLNEVKALIIDKIKKDNRIKIADTKAAQLKSKYSIKNNIDPSIYLM